MFRYSHIKYPLYMSRPPYLALLEFALYGYDVGIKCWGFQIQSRRTEYDRKIQRNVERRKSKAKTG